MVGLMSVCKLILLILWSIGLLLFTSCVKVPEKEFDLHLYQVDKTLLECPSGWLKYRNHCYLIVTEETTFQQADILCKRYGGYLVKVNGYNDNNWFGKLITAHNISDVWLGLQRKKSGDFLWSSGQLAQVEDGFWAEQLPIKSTGYGLCTVLGISLTDFGQYRWRLVNCEIGYSSICQSTACVAGHFRCTDGSGCISNSLVCDGIYQCDDHSDEHNCPGSCGGHLQGRFHTFHSPHFPNDYPRYSSCIWKLETQIGTRIKLKFDSFALEALYDKIIIHDGSSERDPLVGLYSGTDIPNVPYSSSNFYLVIFQSDQDNQMSGFNASFSAEPVSECGSTLNASGTAQWFSSPNFPNSYPNNVLCDWLIMADNSLDLISLQFNSLTLDTSDFIEIRQGESLDSPLYGRYTGDILPPVFVVTSHSVLIRLYTDYTRTGTGFNVTYHTGCNNTVFNGYARVMSPGYSITKYPNNLNCNWTIIDPSQRDLLVLFDDNFDTERGFDIMNITVLPTDNHTFYQHSGHTIPPPIEISTGQFHINFYTDSQVNRNGWSFTVSFDCPTLPLSDHQKKNSSSTKFGTYVHFSCDSGYQLTGTSLLICDIGGRWSASPPTCDVINCGSPTIPIHLELVSVSSTYYLGQAKYRCNPGYKSLDSSTGICQSNGHWTLPVCYENNCPKLVVTDKLQFTTSSESQFSYGDIVSYGCDDNYRLVGASMVYCMRNGTWSKSTPKCIPPLCPPIYIHNGYTNITDSVIGGSFVHVTCNRGYKLFGKQVVSCGLNGIYTTLPTCQDINECSDNTVCGIHTCQNTPGSYRCACNHGYQNPPGNYTVCKDSDECSAFPCSDICENYEGGYRCKCDAGHQLYTDSTVRVVKRKVLRPNSTCIAICPKFTVGNNGIAVADTLPLNSGDYIAPTIITIHCPLGTLPDGSATVECQLDGTWNDTVTTCQDQVCTPLPHPAHGEVVYLNGTRAYNSVVVYTCDNMYRLIGVELRFCQPVNNTGRLEWSGSTPICQEIMCPAIPDPANGKTVYISTRIGAVAEYSCDCGYQLIGSKTRTCQPDGLWDGRNAICVSTSVCQPPASLNVYRMTPTLTFYTIGTGVSLHCQKPGYKLADVTPMKCVIQQPQTATTKPSYILHYKMMFSLPVVYNKTCVELFVNETVEIFTQIAQNKCSILNGPAINITTKSSHSHQMLTIDLSIQISMYKTGVFSSVCNCSNQLKSFTDNGNIQTIVSSLTLNGTHDKICPSYFISNSGNLLFNSEWSCNQGYDLGYRRDICVSDLEPYCYKSTECPNIYGMSTSATSTTTQSTTDSPSAISTTDVNYPISPINDSTTSSSKRSNSIITDVSSLNHSDEPFTTDSKPVELSDPETTTSVNNTIKNSVTSVSSSMTVSEDPLHSTIISSTSQSPQESTDIYTGETIIMESDTSYLTTTALNDTNSITEGVSSEEISSTGKLSSTTKDTLTYTAEPSGNLTSNRAGTSASTSDSITLSPGGKETTLHSITNTLRTETVTRGTNQHITTYQITPESVTNGLTQAETTKFQEVETVTSKSPMLTNTQPMTRETPEITDQFSTMLQSTAGSLTEKQKTEQPSTTDRQQTTSQIFTDRNTEKTTYQQVTADDYTISSIDKQETTKQWTSSDITSVEQTVTTDIIDKSTAGIQGTTENTSSEKVTTVLSTEQTTKSGLKTEEMTTALDTNKITDLSTKSTGLTFTNTDDSTTLDNSNQITDSTNLSTNSQVTVEDIRTSGQLFTTTSGNELTSGNNMEHAQTFRTTKSTTINVMTEEEASSVSQARTSAFNDRTTIQSTQQIVTDEITVSTIIHGQTEVMSTERTTVSTNEITTLKESKQKLTSQQEETTVSASTYQPKQTMSTENIAVSTDEKTTVEQSQPLSSESTITSSDEKTTVHSTQPMTTESTSTSGISTIQPTTQTIQSTTLTVQPTTPAVQPMTPTIQPTTLTTLPPYILPGYVIGIYSELITAINIDQACLDQINILISDVLSSKDGVSNALKTTKSCSKYAINVTMETSVRKPSDVNSIEITKNFSLGGQSQAVLTPCGQVIDELLRKDLAGSLDKILSQTMCLQSVDSTEIRFSQWQCPDGYNMDGSGEICNLITPTTQATVETTTTKPTTTTTKTTTQTTTPGVTLPPTSAAFYLIEVKAIYEGSNLTDGPCVNATRRQIEEKVEIISNGIKTQLNTKKECSKLSDIVLLTRTGKIAVTPERLELTAPFAIQSPSGDIEIVTSCAENAVKTYIENKAQNILNELSPGVCFITIKSFNIPFYGWACNEHYEYDDASQICRLEQTTPATTQSLSLSNGANIQFSVPFATFTMKLQFYKAYAKDPDFCKSEYQKTLISLLWNQTLVLNDKKNSDVQSHCEDVYTSLYGIDSKPDDVVLSLRSTTLDVLIKVKMFAVSSRVVMNSYNVCIGHYSGMFMDISNNVIIGRSNLSSTNGSLCSVPQLKSSNFISNFTYNCSTGYEETSQFLCLKEDRVKYFVPLKLLYSWSAPSSDTCLQALMSALENTSKDYILHYTSSPKCQSNVIIQLNGSISSSYLQTYEAFNITLGYMLSSLDVNLIGGLQRCGDIVTSEIKQFFNNKMNQIRADTIGQCGSGNPSVSMPVFKGYYLCPDNKTWDQGVLQCVSLEIVMTILIGWSENLTFSLNVTDCSTIHSEKYENDTQTSLTTLNPFTETIYEFTSDTEIVTPYSFEPLPKTTTKIPTMHETATQIPALHETTTQIPALPETTSLIPTMHETTSKITPMHETTTQIPTVHETTTQIPTMHETTTQIPTMHETTIKITAKSFETTVVTSLPEIDNDITTIPEITTNIQPLTGIITEITTLIKPTSKNTNFPETTTHLTGITTIPKSLLETTTLPKTTKIITVSETATKLTNIPDITSETTILPEITTETITIQKTTAEATTTPNTKTETSMSGTTTKTTTMPGTTTEAATMPETKIETITMPGTTTETTSMPETSTETITMPEFTSKTTTTPRTTSETTSIPGTTTKTTAIPGISTDASTMPIGTSTIQKTVTQATLPETTTITTSMPGTTTKTTYVTETTRKTTTLPETTTKSTTMPGISTEATTMPETKIETRTMPGTTTETTSMPETSTETITMPEFTSKTTTTPRTTSETTSIPGTTTKSTTYVTETTRKKTSMPGISTEALTMPKTTTKTITMPGTTTETATMSETKIETITMSETTAEATTMSKTTPETVIITETAIGTSTIQKTTTETTTLPETMTETTYMPETTTKTTTMPETTIETTPMPGIATEAMTMPETKTETITMSETTTEATTMPGTTTKTTTVPGTTETTYMPETTTDTTTMPGITTKSTTMSETTTDTTTIQKPTAESTILPETMTKTTPIYEPVTGTTYIAETTTKTTLFPETTTETTMLETLSETTTIPKTTADTTTLPESTTEIFTMLGATTGTTTISQALYETTTVPETKNAITLLEKSTDIMISLPLTVSKIATLPDTTKEITIVPETSQKITNMAETTTKITTMPQTTSEKTTLPETTTEITTFPETATDITALSEMIKEITILPETTSKITTLPETTTEITTLPGTTTEITSITEIMTLPETTIKETTWAETTMKISTHIPTSTIISSEEKTKKMATEMSSLFTNSLTSSAMTVPESTTKKIEYTYSTLPTTLLSDTTSEASTTSATTVGVIPAPSCYVCSKGKDDPSCNVQTRQCNQGASCSTEVYYNKKKAAITKKCIDTDECLRLKSSFKCEPTNYSTKCLYCCLESHCNEVTILIEFQDGRRRRSAWSFKPVLDRSKQIFPGVHSTNQRQKRSTEETPNAFWNSSVPTCKDIEPPVFRNCPQKNVILYKEFWGPVMAVVNLPSVVDNSGISPRVTVTPTDFRQPYMFRQNTTISMLAEDLSGNKAFCNINVTVIDVYPLVIQCPVDVVRVSYPTINDSVQTNYSGVKASEAAVKITYNPPNGSLVQIKDLVNVMAIAHDRFGNTTSCQFTYEATRNEQLPQYRIKVNYNTPTLEFSDNCSRQYGRKIIEKIHALEQLIPDCNNSFNLMPDTVQDTPEKLTIETSVIFANFGTLDFGKMEKCGRTAITKIKELGNLTITVATCPEYILTLLNDEPTPKFLCEGHYMVLNQTSKFCSYCRKGTYVNSMAGRCEVCPLAPDSTQSECQLCTGDNTNCIGTCKPGEYSPTGLQPCTKCSNNSYSDSYKSTICKSCPTGQFTLSTGTNSQNGCLDVCPIGEYSSSGLVPCKPCPVMFYSNKTQSQHCIECPRGLVTTSNGSTSLSQCVDPAICSGNVCNGGTCIPVDNGRYFTCQCPPGITGTICELDVQECSSNPCIHGDCIDENNSYTCVCQTGYTGHNCETNIDNCFPGACINSTCVDGDDTYSCLCYDGYTGNSTCTEINECDPDPCRHGGICIDLINDFICNCSGTGYVGKTCDLLTERCYNGSCLNDGVCHPHDNGYSCSCAQGFTGRYCEVNINDCEGHYCKNGAVCIDGVDQYSCLCQAGYTGDQCSINMMCDTSPCFNAALCTTTTTGFQCHCPPGYTGVLCEVNIDECKNNMCNPEKSQCKDDINSYTCDCLPGWTGKYCTQPINDCLSIPCAHGSTCIDLDDQYLCNCNEGFTGHNCSINIDECESNPCFNGGQCIDEVSGYTCICRGSFKGKQCQIQIDLCADTPCLHNGTCQNLVDSYLCWCELGWTGVRCETMVNNCISLPCANNGTCFNGINQYSCNCLQGYTGSHCQEDINECLNHPCLNGGQCVNLIGGYQCLCLDGFHGHDCNDLDQICPVCQNGATECYNGNCVCLPGFVGPDCGKERNPGYDLYFHDNTSLETNVTRMKNRNNLSVCLWVKVLSLSEGQPVFSLNAVLRGNKEQEILSLTTKRLHLGYYGDTWVNLTTTPGVWTYLCFTWDSNNNGHWKVYIDGQLQIEGVGYGNGQELPPLQKVALGKPTVENSTTFHGLISQLNVYDHILNSTTISNSSDNCSVSVSPGTVFRWQQFSAYVRPGIGVEEPSVCGSEVCPGDYNGQFCDDSVDTKSPTIEYCPEYVQVVTSNRLNIINWTEPRFTDDVEIVNVVQTHRPGEVFAYGEYDVMYIAYDSENNTAVCSFTVYVIPSNCSKPKAPPNVSLTCADWSKGISCSVRCNQPSIHNFVEQIPSFYKCGREGFWDPPRGKDFTFPICAESSEPSSTIQGEMVFLGPICSTEYKQLLGENFNKNMNQWNMEFGLCPTTGCNFSNVTIACNMARRRKRSTDSTYYVTFDIPVNGSLMTDSADALPLTQLETMIKNKEFNTADFSCDPEKLVVKPYIKCQLGQILVNGLCVNCAKGTYFNSVTGTCEVCQRGQYTDQEKQVACLSCDSGFTTENTGSTSSSSCYKVCPAGDYYDSKMSGCKSCPRGYYQDLTGTTSCKSCGNGQTTQETGSVSVSDCQSTCKAGTELSIYGICEPCALGTYKPTDGENSCLPCPYGKSTETVGAISQEQCSVISCPQDFYYDLESNGCKVCPPGYHQPYQGQRSCIPCTKFDFHVIKCSSGEVDECILGQDNCNENADCVDTKDSFQCNCKWGYTGNGTYCQDKCSGACGHGSACIIDNNGEPVCKTITSDTFPIIAVAGGASSFVLIFMLIGTVIICRRRSQQKKRKHGSHNYQHIDRVHRHIEVVTYPRGVARTVQFRTNPAYSDSELSDPTYFGEPTALWTRTMYPDHEDLTQYSETSMTRPLRLRIPTAVRIQHNYETESNKSWHESTAGSDLSQFQDDSDPHHSSPNSSISKYRVDSNPKDSSPSSSISQYKEDSLHKNDSPISNKSDLSDSYF